MGEHSSGGVTLADIRASAERIAGAIWPTPLVRLPIEGEVWAKAENLQRTGSFKLRGAFNFLSNLSPEERRRGVVAHSSGNHAQGVACAAHLLGVHATIVIPEGAPEVKVARTRSWGAEIVRCESSSDAREAVAGRLAEERGLVPVPPFDHPWIVAGQGTVGLEIAEALPMVANVLVPVGGGGLSAGVATAVAELLPQAQTIGVEPEVAADAADSLAQGWPVRWPAERVGSTMADGVRTQRIGDLNFSLLQRFLAGVVTVDEDAIARATSWYAKEARLVVEPTGALTLAAYLAMRDRGASEFGLREGPTVLVISGGNLDPERLTLLLAAAAG